jgi:alkanesulfonate monooxygenase SsuD/methylene tetrahydromethanopterin reductase-like flavin-dependent oxidoreductase (luciferase family)
MVERGDVALYAPQRQGLTACLEAAQAAERGGWAGVWFGEPALAADPLVAAAAGATATSTLPIGVALANVWRMLPATLASAVRSLADVAPGRLTMTLGPWSEPLATQAGATRRRPVDAMVDSTLIVRRLLAGETVTHSGPVFSVSNIALNRDPVEVPLLWGVMGPRMTAAAGRHADGVVVNYAATRDRVRDVITGTRRAAEEAGRDPDRLQFPVAVLVDVDDDADAAVERFRHSLETVQVLRAEAHLPAGAVTAADAAARAAVGSPERVRARLTEYLEAGADELIIVAMNPSPVAAIGRILEGA